MPAIRRSALVRHTPQQMFDLVNDIESYPSFVPWCRAARIDVRAPGELVATIEIARGRLSREFSTRNLLQPPGRIEMKLVRGPFRSLSGEWSFTDYGAGLCRVEFSLVFEYSSRLVALTLGPLFARVTDSLVQAFCRRAAQLYGDAGAGSAG